MKTANDALFDAAIRHQIDIGRYSNSVVRRMMAILNRVDKDLFAELIAALSRLEPESFTVERLEGLLGSVRSLNAQAYAQVDSELRAELREFTAYEAAYQQMALRSVLPLQVEVAAVTADQVYAAAMSRPFQGVLLRGALDDLSAGRARKVRQSVAQGYVEGKTSTQIARELRGTRALNYADGLWEGERRHLQTIVQTAIAHTANFAREQVYQANDDILKGVMWSAKLDLRTSEKCRIRDHKMWDTKGKPIGHTIPWLGGPPAHYNCRSTSAPVVKGFAELLGIDFDDSSLPAGTRASLDGQVAANQSYGEWLAKQTAERQDDVLGPVRGKLLRSGKLPVDQMYSARGEFLTLEQLREKDADAFRRAGL